MNNETKKKNNISFCYILFICITRGDSVFHKSFHSLTVLHQRFIIGAYSKWTKRIPSMVAIPCCHAASHNPCIRFSYFFPPSLPPLLSFFLSSNKSVGYSNCDSCAWFKDHISRIVRVLTWTELRACRQRFDNERERERETKVLLAASFSACGMFLDNVLIEII